MRTRPTAIDAYFLSFPNILPKKPVFWACGCSASTGAHWVGAGGGASWAVTCAIGSGMGDAAGALSTTAGAGATATGSGADTVTAAASGVTTDGAATST